MDLSQVTTGLRRILGSPVVYSAFQYLMGARNGWRQLVNVYIRPDVGMRILDIGCGPADLLEYLGKIEYWGFDISEDYIEHAKRKYGSRGKFFCQLLNASDLVTMPQFDRVVLSGVLHHLDDAEASKLLALSFQALRPGGWLIAVDPCFADGQNPIARYLIECDRGKNVRVASAYEMLARPAFDMVNAEVRHKRWIPYTHCYMKCVKSDASLIEHKE